MLSYRAIRRIHMIRRELRIQANALMIIILDNIDIHLTFGKTHMAVKKTLTRKSHGL